MTHSDIRQVIKAPNVLVQVLEGEAVLLNLDNGYYLGWTRPVIVCINFLWQAIQSLTHMRLC